MQTIYSVFAEGIQHDKRNKSNLEILVFVDCFQDAYAKNFRNL